MDSLEAARRVARSSSLDRGAGELPVTADRPGADLFQEAE